MSRFWEVLDDEALPTGLKYFVRDYYTGNIFLKLWNTSTDVRSLYRSQDEGKTWVQLCAETTEIFGEYFGNRTGISGSRYSWAVNNRLYFIAIEPLDGSGTNSVLYYSDDWGETIVRVYETLYDYRNISIVFNKQNPSEYMIFRNYNPSGSFPLTIFFTAKNTLTHATTRSWTVSRVLLYDTHYDSNNQRWLMRSSSGSIHYTNDNLMDGAVTVTWHEIKTVDNAFIQAISIFSCAKFILLVANSYPYIAERPLLYVHDTETHITGLPFSFSTDQAEFGVYSFGQTAYPFDVDSYDDGTRRGIMAFLYELGTSHSYSRPFFISVGTISTDTCPITYYDLRLRAVLPGWPTESNLTVSVYLQFNLGKFYVVCNINGVFNLVRCLDIYADEFDKLNLKIEHLNQIWDVYGDTDPEADMSPLRYYDATNAKTYEISLVNIEDYPNTAMRTCHNGTVYGVILREVEV